MNGFFDLFQALHEANQATSLPGDPLLLPGELPCSSGWSDQKMYVRFLAYIIKHRILV